MIAITVEQHDTIVAILERIVPHCTVWAFGSRYHGTHREHSDLDVVLIGDAALPLLTMADVKDAFQESNLPFRVDVLDWHATSEAFRNVIKAGYAVLQYARWREVRLGEVVESISQTHKLDKDKIIPINTSDIFDGKLLNHEYVDKKKLKGQFKKSFQIGDIIYSEIRPHNKRFAYIEFNSEDYIASTRLMVIRKKNEKILSKYLYQILKSEEMISSLQTIAESRSGTFPQITFSELSRIKIVLPSCDEQQAIAATLSCLDDKIELNNRINKNLEEMAQAIFKSWFVDFEPFQDGEFEESELGMIPKGWRVGSLDEVANYVNGLAMQKHRPKSEKYIPVIKIKELNQEMFDSNSDKASEDIPKQYIIENGDVIFSWSGTLLVKIWTGGKGALNQHLFKVTSDKYEQWFYYFWTLHHLSKFRAIANDKATTMGHIKRSHLSESKVIIPDAYNLSKLNYLMTPLLRQVIDNNIQNGALREQRDTLLPKLMSGEIRIPLEEV